MRTLLLALGLAFAVIGGTAVISAATSAPAYADGSGNGGGGN